jgi:hypothetical protein
MLSDTAQATARSRQGRSRDDSQRFMSMSLSTQPGSILPQPPRPGFFRVCPACDTWFALQRVEVPTKVEPKIESKLMYQCRVCGKRFEFADRHLPYAV